MLCSGHTLKKGISERFLNNLPSICLYQFIMMIFAHFTCLCIFQFFTKPKPPKGYYIYGDVGKPWNSQNCISQCNEIKIFSKLRRSFCFVRLFQARGKRWSWTCFIHMWRLRTKRGFISMVLCQTCIKVSTVVS